LFVCGFGLGDRDRDFLEASLSLREPKMERLGVVGDGMAGGEVLLLVHLVVECRKQTNEG
jgi:hypothetical protein